MSKFLKHLGIISISDYVLHTNTSCCTSSYHGKFTIHLDMWYMLLLPNLKTLHLLICTHPWKALLCVVKCWFIIKIAKPPFYFKSCICCYIQQHTWSNLVISKEIYHVKESQPNHLPWDNYCMSPSKHQTKTSQPFQPHTSPESFHTPLLVIPGRHRLFICLS